MDMEDVLWMPLELYPPLGKLRWRIAPARTTLRALQRQGFQIDNLVVHIDEKYLHARGMFKPGTAKDALNEYLNFLDFVAYSYSAAREVKRLNGFITHNEYSPFNLVLLTKKRSHLYGINDIEESVPESLNFPLLDVSKDFLGLRKLPGMGNMRYSALTKAGRAWIRVWGVADASLEETVEYLAEHLDTIAPDYNVRLSAEQPNWQVLTPRDDLVMDSRTRINIEIQHSQ